MCPVITRSFEQHLRRNEHLLLCRTPSNLETSRINISLLLSSSATGLMRSLPMPQYSRRPTNLKGWRAGISALLSIRESGRVQGKGYRANQRSQSKSAVIRPLNDKRDFTPINKQFQSCRNNSGSPNTAA